MHNHASSSEHKGKETKKTRQEQTTPSENRNNTKGTQATIKANASGNKRHVNTQAKTAASAITNKERQTQTKTEATTSKNEARNDA